MSEDNWREDDDSRVVRALAAMSERVEELEQRVSMLEDEVGFLELDDDDEEIGFLGEVDGQDKDGEEVSFLGDIDDDEEEDQQIADDIKSSENDVLHSHEDVVRELGDD